MTEASPPEIGDLLKNGAAMQPGKALFTYLAFDGADPRRVSYGELYGQARTVATRLKRAGLQGRPVLLLYPASPAFAPAFFGTLLARAIAVPAPCPSLRGHYDRLDGIAVDCRPGAVLSTTAVIAGLQEKLAPDSPLRACPWIATDAPDTAEPAPEEAGAPSDIALLQYTSGSTAAPRGAMVTHANLAHNAAMIARAFELPTGARGVSWLPHHHDMGLIAGFVAPLTCGGESILLSPESFLRRPLRWLEAISHYRGQICGAPNFAYDLCTRSADRGPFPALDLSSWQTAFVGAEPVRASTMKAFVDRFRDSGFAPSALTPCYGLAEATVLVSCTPPRALPAFHSLSREALEAGEVKHSDGSGGLTLVGCGPPVAGTTVRIVEPTSGRPLGAGQVGEVWVAGPQVARGYWGRDGDGVFDASLAGAPGKSFLRTGDLGFLADGGELVFVERLKDVIVFNGQKYPCHDLELTAGSSHEALSPDGCAAVSLDVGDKPHLVLIAELRRQSLAEAVDAARAVRAAWFTTHGLPARTIAFVARGKLSRTTSGKLQRRLSAGRLCTGALDVLILDGEALPTSASVSAGG